MFVPDILYGSFGDNVWHIISSNQCEKMVFVLNVEQKEHRICNFDETIKLVGAEYYEHLWYQISHLPNLTVTNATFWMTPPGHERTDCWGGA